MPKCFANLSGERLTHESALALVMKDVAEAGFRLTGVDEAPKRRVYRYVKWFGAVGDFEITVTVPDLGYPRVWSTRINERNSIVSSAAKWRAQLRALQPWSPPASSSEGSQTDSQERV